MFFIVFLAKGVSRTTPTAAYRDLSAILTNTFQPQLLSRLRHPMALLHIHNNLVLTATNRTRRAFKLSLYHEGRAIFH